MTRPGLVFSCEHGGYEIPASYRRYFPDPDVLASHRGWDAGALILARHLAQHFKTPLFNSETSRLLIDLNRSPHHRALYSEYSKRLDKAGRDRVFQTHYRPYRRSVKSALKLALQTEAPVIHISVHSFCPELNGESREADIGLLYDPSRLAEKQLCLQWQHEFRLQGQYRVRRNYPYLGIQDGLVTAMRKALPEHYIGIELETNQRFVLAGGKVWTDFCRTICDALDKTLASYKA